MIACLIPPLKKFYFSFPQDSESFSSIFPPPPLPAQIRFDYYLAVGPLFQPSSLDGLSQKIDLTLPVCFSICKSAERRVFIRPRTNLTQPISRCLHLIALLGYIYAFQFFRPPPVRASPDAPSLVLASSPRYSHYTTFLN